MVGKNNYGKTAIFEAIRLFFGDLKLITENIHMHRVDQLPVITITINFVEVDDVSMQILTSEFEPVGDRITIKAYFTTTASGSYRIKYTNLNNDSSITPKDLKSCLPEIKYISSIRQPEDTTFNNKSSNLQQLMDLLITESEEDEISFNERNYSIKDIKRNLQEHEKRKVDNLSRDLTSIKINVENTDISHKHKTNIINNGITEQEGSTNDEFDILSRGTGMQSLIILSILEASVE
ncbi:hypothetical protein [Virgibacillus halodenitrificans]|uniref:hypothetical protein n=1 Tax=Virgibacillus halodenitrificans TaxID=1482 RepID=UPI003C772C61